MTQPPWGAPGGGPDDSSQSLPDPPNPYAQQSPYAQPPTPYAPPPQPGPRRGLSITAFVLGLIGCIPLVSVAAVIVGVVALLKKQALRGLAIAGIALGAMWIAATILFFTSGAASDFARGFQEAMEEGLGESQVDRDSSGQVTESQTASSQALRLGDCFNDDAAIDVSDETIESLPLEVVPCSSPHMFEVFHVEEMEGDGFPGEDAVVARADETCVEAFEPFVGISYADSLLGVVYYFPQELAWRALGDRSIVCAVTDLTESTGSLKGSAR